MSERHRRHRPDKDEDTGEATDRGTDESQRDPQETGDFADEHRNTTFADQMDGGPEGIPEPESPEGRGGDGGMD